MPPWNRNDHLKDSGATSKPASYPKAGKFALLPRERYGELKGAGHVKRMAV